PAGRVRLYSSAGHFSFEGQTCGTDVDAEQSAGKGQCYAGGKHELTIALAYRYCIPHAHSGRKAAVRARDSRISALQPSERHHDFPGFAKHRGSSSVAEDTFRTDRDRPVVERSGSGRPLEL